MENKFFHNIEPRQVTENDNDMRRLVDKDVLNVLTYWVRTLRLLAQNPVKAAHHNWALAPVQPLAAIGFVIGPSPDCDGHKK